MKKILLTLIILSAFISCKSVQNTTVNTRKETFMNELWEGKITYEEYVYLCKAEDELTIFKKYHENKKVHF